jgi:hypothetical protein
VPSDIVVQPANEYPDLVIEEFEVNVKEDPLVKL